MNVPMRENALQLIDSSSTNGTIEAATGSDIFLERFHSIDLHKLITTLSSLKMSTCALDPILTRLLKDGLPSVSTLLLNIINLSLVTGYVPQSFKVALIKLLLKNLR